MATSTGVCAKCEQVFTFTPGRGRPRKYCDGCSHRKSSEKYRKANPEIVAQRTKAWREANPERAKELGRRWREENRDLLTARAKEAWINDRDRKNEWHRQWRHRNMAKISARVIQWQKDNPEKVAARQARRRARKSGAVVVDFTSTDWAALLEEHNHACFYCGATGVRLEQEHRTPLARGGDHTKANIVPACGPCNRHKATMTAEEFLRAGGRDRSRQGRVGHHREHDPSHGIAG